jgi:hypothetical protein
MKNFYILENIRTVFFVLAMLIENTSWGQIENFNGTWISKSNDVLFINDPLFSTKLCNDYREEEAEVYLLGDTLSFQYQFYSSHTNFEKLYTDRYDLLISKLTDSSFIAVPTSKLSKEFFDNRSSITFIKQGFNKDKSFHLEKIIYHTTSCYGSCPVIDLEIQNNKNLYLNGRFYRNKSMYDIDSTKSGNFYGKLNDTVYLELIDILKTLDFKNFNFPERLGADAPIKTLIVYHNGRRKYFKSMFPPAILYRLLAFLQHIGEHTSLIRTNDLQTIEK